jgi:diketogulonate reductase-like aldo/keto reductase
VAYEAAVRLNSGHEMPAIGLGTWPLRGAEAEQAVASGIAIGYRHIDTAAKYANEDAVGRGIRMSGVLAASCSSRRSSADPTWRPDGRGPDSSAA